MLAYIIEKHLREIWKQEDLTIQEGLNCLAKITSFSTSMEKDDQIRMVNPDPQSKQLLDKAGIKLPAKLPKSKLNVVTKKKISKQ